jgi:probable HAF family extracellular repeat protein
MRTRSRMMLIVSLAVTVGGVIHADEPTGQNDVVVLGHRSPDVQPVEKAAYSLNDAICQNDVEYVRQWVAQGKPIPNSGSVPPLCYAAMEGRYEITRLLIQGGAKPNVPSKHGLTPLIGCARSLGNWYEQERRSDLLMTMQLLLNHGAHVDAIEPHSGYTALVWALLHAHSNEVSQRTPYTTCYIDLLIENGADLMLVPQREFKDAIDRYKASGLVCDYKDVTYTAEDVGTFDAFSSRCYGINSKEQIVGSFVLERGRVEYFLREPSGTLKVIKLPQQATPVAINNRGQITGNYINPQGDVRGFIWDAERGWRDLGTLGGKKTCVTAMNNSGQIVGWSQTGRPSQINKKSMEQHAFVWTRDKLVDLGALIGDLGMPGDTSTAVDINDKGDVVGHSNKTISKKGAISASKPQAFRCSVTNHQLNEISPGSFSQACLVTKSGDVVFVEERTSNRLDYKVRLQSGTIQVLSVDHRHMAPITRNNNGAFVLGVPIGDATLFYRNPCDCCEEAYKPLVISTALLPDFWWDNVVNISGINNDGVMVGSAIGADGAVHAVLLRPTD